MCWGFFLIKLQAFRPDAYPFSGFLRPELSPWGYGSRCFLVSLCHLIVRRPNFNHNFQNCINPLCSCSLEIESTSHFLLHCHHYTNTCVTLLNSIVEIIGNTFNINNECLVSLLLFSIQKYTEIDNSHIVNATIKYY